MSESISFLVSVYDRPHFLNACLATLAVQPDPKHVAVLDNSTDSTMSVDIGLIAHRYGFDHALTGRRGAANCYEAANLALTEGNIYGDWICFPSDDSLYVCGFSEIILAEAQRTGAGLIYCDCVYRQDPLVGSWPAYQVLESSPKMGRIDKSNFIVRRKLFTGFPRHEKGWCDGAFVEQLVQRGVRTAKAPGCLVVHQ